MRKSLLTLVPLLFLVACDQEPAAPAIEAVALTPANNWMNNPDNGNPRILRSQFDLAVSWTDPSNGLRASHWTYQAVAGCGDTPDGGFADWQEVATIDLNDFLASRFIANVMGKVWIRIRDLNTPGDCFGARLVATGWGTLHYTDNDEIGLYPPDQKYVNAWGFMARGTLTTPDGKQLKYIGHYRATFNLSSEALHENFQVNLR